MATSLFREGDFNVWLCRGDVRIPCRYQTHRIVDGELVKVPWTQEKLLAAMQEVQRKSYPRSRQADRWYFKIELKPGTKLPGMIG